MRNLLYAPAKLGGDNHEIAHLICRRLFHHVSNEGLRTILATLAEKEPKAKQVKVEDFIDMRFVAELEKEGLFRKLWGK